MDLTGLDRQIIFWPPMAHITSMFGHVSSVGGAGENNSFGESGWDTKFPTAESYIQRQTGPKVDRSGLGLTVRLTSSQDEVFDRCIAENKSNPKSYSVLLNNCTSAAQECLTRAGVNFEPSISPAGFQAELIGSGAVSSTQWYRPSK